MLQVPKGGAEGMPSYRRRSWIVFAAFLLISALVVFEVGIRQAQPDTVIYQRLDDAARVTTRAVITDPETVALWTQEIPSGRPVSFIQQAFSGAYMPCHSITSGAYHDRYTYTFLRQGITVRFVEQSWWSCGMIYTVSSGGLPDWNEYQSSNVIMP